MADFFEEDEPMEAVKAAFDAGPHGRTARPMGGWIAEGPIGAYLTSSCLVGTPSFAGRPMKRVKSTASRPATFTTGSSAATYASPFQPENIR